MLKMKRGISMLRLNDFILLLVIFGSILGGIFVPSTTKFLQPYPLYFIMFLLFLSFLSIKLGDIWDLLVKQWKIALWLTGVKLLLLPFLNYVLLRVTFPDFAVAGLLISGVSTGVVAPFIAILAEADEALVLLLVVTTSFLVPFTLPVIVKSLVGKTMAISLLAMMQMLGMMIFVPVLSVGILRRLYSPLPSFLLKHRFPISLVTLAAMNLGIFSRYSSYFHQKPGMILFAGLIAFFLGFVYLVFGIGFLWRGRVEEQVSSAIILGNMNNVLIIVFAAQFFGPREATVAAIYMIPFFMIIFPLKLYRQWRIKR